MNSITAGLDLHHLKFDFLAEAVVELHNHLPVIALLSCGKYFLSRERGTVISKTPAKISDIFFIVWVRLVFKKFLFFQQIVETTTTTCTLAYLQLLMLVSSNLLKERNSLKK